MIIMNVEKNHCKGEKLEINVRGGGVGPEVMKNVQAKTEERGNEELGVLYAVDR